METKRITAVVMCLIMVFVLLPNAAFANEPTYVVVGGTDVSGGGYWLNDGKGGIATATSENYNVHYEASTSTLTLNGANITKNYKTTGTYTVSGYSIPIATYAAIYADRALTINLIGRNTLSGEDGSTDGMNQSFGIYGSNDIIIEGNGRLDATGGAGSTGIISISSGVSGNSVIIKGGTVKATGGDVETGVSYGVIGINVTILGGTLETTGGDVTEGNSYGVNGDNILINGGSVTATGGNTAAELSYGIFGNDSVTISDGTLKAIGGNVTDGTSGGVFGATVTTLGGTVTATGGEVESGVSNGLRGDIIAISGGTVKTTGGVVTAGWSNGMRGDDRITISGGEVTATGGKATSSFGVFGSNADYINDSANIVNITGGTVTAIGGESTSLSCGINGNIRVIIENSTVTANGGSASGGGEASGTSLGLYSNNVEIKSGTVKVTGGSASNGYSYGVYGYNLVTIAGGTVSAKSGAAKGISYGISSSNDSGTGNVAITGGTVETIGGEVTDGLSNGVFGNIVGINGGTVLAKGNSSAIRKSSETTLSIFSNYTALHTTVVSENISGLPAVSPADDLEIYKYLRVAPGEVTISDVSVNGKQNSTITEANAIIALSTKTFNAMNEGADVSDWFTNMPKGLTATIKTDVATGAKIATVTFSGRPEVASTAVMEITIPSDKLSDASDSIVTVNENAKWNIIKPSPSYDYTPTQVTLYNDPYAPHATIWLAGAGLASDDRLITERNPQGAVYSLLRSVAGGNEVFATYNISLKSGSKSSGNSMSLTFDLAATYAGQAFTLVHQKADGTYEYFYAVADANGNLVFGPLFELSPFMLVKGTLAQTAFVSLSDAPKTGDNSQTALWTALASTMAAVLLLGTALRKRRN